MSIGEICELYKIKNYQINPDMSIDVDGDVCLHNEDLTSLPLKFGKVTGYFNCGSNKLKSLRNSRYVYYTKTST